MIQNLRPQAVPKHEGHRLDALLAAYDPWLIGCFVFMVSAGLVMVASASITVADRNFQEPLYYFWRQSLAVLVGLTLALIVIKSPLHYWQRAIPLFLGLAVLLLVLVLIPGLGREVNGSMRWIALGPVSLQASEPVKLCFIIYLAGYMVRHGDQVRSTFAGLIKPLGMLTIIAGLLLLEPDYGVTVVLFATTLGMLFMGGVSMTRFIAWGLVTIAALAAIALPAPYRWERLMAFMNPWADPYNKGFQLTQALIAFGRGEWFGVGLGGSVQKLFYLPEAHTDFIFAVLAEEFGLVGTVMVIAVFSLVVWRAFHIGGQAERAGQLFAAYLAFGIGLLIGLQAFINIGVNMGMLPTKGLTLPLISYGSNSMIVTCVGFGLLLRIEHESRFGRRGQAYAA
jgi:cell division protein FtsW